jgi:hypothetical protein
MYLLRSTLDCRASPNAFKLAISLSLAIWSIFRMNAGIRVTARIAITARTAIISISVKANVVGRRAAPSRAVQGGIHHPHDRAATVRSARWTRADIAAMSHLIASARCPPFSFTL